MRLLNFLCGIPAFWDDAWDAYHAEQPQACASFCKSHVINGHATRAVTAPRGLMGVRVQGKVYGAYGTVCTANLTELMPQLWDTFASASCTVTPLPAKPQGARRCPKGGRAFM